MDPEESSAQMDSSSFDYEKLFEGKKLVIYYESCFVGVTGVTHVLVVQVLCLLTLF